MDFSTIGISLTPLIRFNLNPFFRHLFNRDRILVTSPKGLAEVLTTKSYDFVKPDMLRTGLIQILGEGILLAEGDVHKIQRRGLQPAFAFRHVKELYPIFWDKAKEMVGCVEAALAAKSAAGSTTIEMGEWFSRATLDIIGKAGLGQDFNSLADPDTDLNRSYRKIFAPSRAAQLLGILQFFLPGWLLQNLPIQRSTDIAAAAKTARDTARQIVRNSKLAIEQKKELKPDITSIALESGVFTEDELVNNMMTFLAAGHETTSTALTWAVYLLSKHPSIQFRLRSEIHAHINSLDDSIDSTKLDSCTYLSATCNEVLRLYSPVPMTLRSARIDTSILGQFIPRDTKVIMAPWATNLDTSLWGPDAAEFSPDRWISVSDSGNGNGTGNGKATVLNHSGGASSNYAFLTFLHGPRSCIGQKFAVAEMAALLGTFVGAFEFEMMDHDEKIDIRGGITSRPRNGMRLNLRRVEGW